MILPLWGPSTSLFLFLAHESNYSDMEQGFSIARPYSLLVTFSVSSLNEIQPGRIKHTLYPQLLSSYPQEDYTEIESIGKVTKQLREALGPQSIKINRSKDIKGMSKDHVKPDGASIELWH